MAKGSSENFLRLRLIVSIERARTFSKRFVSGILFALLLTSMFAAAFNIRSVDGNARLQEHVQVEDAEPASIISWRDAVALQQSNVATVEMPLKPCVAFMRPAIRDGGFADLDSLPDAIYDEQLGLTFTQNFTHIAYNVTAVQQSDSFGYGPAYLLNGVTNEGYWYQAGLSFDWPYTSGGYNAGFNFNYEVFNNKGESIFPTSGGGGLESFIGRVNNGDTVLLDLYFSSGNIVMHAYDWITGARATVTYTAVGSLFQGQTETWSAANGFFTGLMTEWWHANAYYGGEAQVVYNDTTFALSSGWLWADEWVPSNGTALFSGGQDTSFSNPTQLQYFSANGTSDAASGYLFITGALPATTIFLTPYRIEGIAGQNVTVYANITNVTGLLTYQIGLTWSNATAVECTSVTNGSILNNIPNDDVTETPGAINNTLGKITSPYEWSGLGSQYNINGSGTLAVFTFRMLQTGYADVHVNDVILYYKDGVTIIPFNTIDYFTAVYGGNQYIVRVEGNPVELSSNYGGFGAESVTQLSPTKVINDNSYLGNMTADVNGTSDGVGPFAYLNATIPNILMNCSSKDRWIVEIDGVPQSGVLVSSGTQNTTISVAFIYPSSSSGELTQTIEILSNYIAASTFSATISPTSVILDLDQSELFTSSVSGGSSPFSYQWYLNGSAVSGAINATWTFTPSSAGSYVVYVEVTDAASVVATSNAVTATVNPALSVSISPPSATLDVGQSQTFNSTISGGASFFSYQWYANGTPISNATDANWTFSPSSYGSYLVYVKVTDNVEGKANSNSARVTVNGALSVSISPSTLVMDVGQSQVFNSSVLGGTSPFSYQWYLNGSAISGAINATWTFTPSSAGSYIVYVNITDTVSATAASNTGTVKALPAIPEFPAATTLILMLSIVSALILTLKKRCKPLGT